MRNSSDRSDLSSVTFLSTVIRTQRTINTLGIGKCLPLLRSVPLDHKSIAEGKSSSAIRRARVCQMLCDPSLFCDIIRTIHRN